MRGAMFGVISLLALISAAAVYLWALQNADQTAQLQLDLGSYVGAWRMATPQPVPMMLIAAWVVGLASGLLWGGLIGGRRQPDPFQD